MAQLVITKYMYIETFRKTVFYVCIISIYRAYHNIKMMALVLIINYMLLPDACERF